MISVTSNDILSNQKQQQTNHNVYLEFWHESRFTAVRRKIVKVLTGLYRNAWLETICIVLQKCIARNLQDDGIRLHILKDSVI